MLKKQLEQMLKNTEKMLKKPWHNSVPPQQLHWVRIILGKLDTIQYPHTNRDTTLIV